LARLYGTAGAQRIRAAHVVVVGVGGVGSWAAEALARSGVAKLTLIDLDHVSESNINRQVHALTDTVGQAKVLAMAERIHAIHPGCEVRQVEAFVDADNWPQLCPTDADAVIDACDQVRAKVAMAAWARGAAKGDWAGAFVAVGAAGGKQRAHLVDLADLSQVTHDPLLAQVRQHLRRHHGAPREGRVMGLSCVFSREAVAVPVVAAARTVDGVDGVDAVDAVQSPSDATLNCHGYGSVVSVTATFGLCAAGHVLQALAQATPVQTA
jgi:tRNA A37 threonylcarbamoyladenosine dehydratase